MRRDVAPLSKAPPDQHAAGDALPTIINPSDHHDSEFERLLRLLRHEHTKLMHENEILRARASAALEPEADPATSQGAVAREAARGAHDGPPGSALAPIAPGGVFEANAKGASDKVDVDVGITKDVEGLVVDRMERFQAQGGKPRGTFNFKGAERVKASLHWVRTDKFDLYFAAIILLNALYIGVETSLTLTTAKDDKAAGGDGKIDKSLWIVGDLIFAMAFLFEIVMRVFAYQVKFFTGSPRWWNFFDVVTIFAGFVAIVFELSGAPPNFYINFVKLVRLARLVRSLKISKSRLFHNLRTLSYTVAGSANAFLSAIILLIVVMYVFGVMFMQGVQEYLRRPEAVGVTVTELDAYFGDITNTFFTLLKCITGGMDWQEVGESLAEIEVSYQVFFGLYITFTVLCILNILNGVFVSVAIESAQTNKELAIETTHYKFLAITHQMLEWFIEADKDLSGKVSWEEMRTLLKDANMRNFFMANGIDVTSAAQIFSLLDQDGSGELSPDEFVNNLLQLQGQAKAVDLAMLKRVCDDMAVRVQAMEESLRPSRAAAPARRA